MEFNSVIDKHQNIRSALVERMPVLDEATYRGRSTGSLPATVSTSDGASVSEAKVLAIAPLVDLIDLSSDIVPAPSSSGGDMLHDLLALDLLPAAPQSGTSNSMDTKSGTNPLLDLLSVRNPPLANNQPTSYIVSFSVETKSQGTSLDGLSTLSSVPMQITPAGEAIPAIDLLNSLSNGQPSPVIDGSDFSSIVAFESSSLKMTFDFSKPSGSPQTTLIKATFINILASAYTDFIFQAAVPKFLQLHLEPASGNKLPASGSGSITQNLRVTNSQHGKKPLVMRIRIGYKIDGKDVLEQGQINNFPRNL